MRTPPTESEVDFSVDEQRMRGAVVLAVHGDADLHTASMLRDRLDRAIDGGASGVVVDLSDASFFDSTALGVLVGGMKRLRATRRQLRLVAPRPEVRRLLEITLLDHVFAIDATRDDALGCVGLRGGPF
jgi:anti-sigma B factor antagonist